MDSLACSVFYFLTRFFRFQLAGLVRPARMSTVTPIGSTHHPTYWGLTLLEVFGYSAPWVHTFIYLDPSS